MPNEPSYGGFISVRRNGSVVWQVASREFPKDRDTDGTLEYAIRVATSERNSFASRDGKCLITVDVQASSLNVDGPGSDKAKFLIVSGYDAPDAPYDGVVVGKSYFVTSNRLAGSGQRRLGTPAEADEGSTRGTAPGAHDHANHEDASSPATYDLSLRYDDYDLERAGLPADLDVDELAVYYQNSISLKDVFDHYNRKGDELLSQYRSEIGAQEKRLTQVAAAFSLNGEALKAVIVWTLTYRHLRAMGIDRDLIDDLEDLVYPLDEEDRDAWYSRWLQVTTGDGHHSAQRRDDRISNSGLGFQITAEDLRATPGAPIIEAAGSLAVPGSRTITLRGLTAYGAFALVYHGKDSHYDRRDHAG